MPRQEEYVLGRALGDTRARPMLLYGSKPMSPHPLGATLNVVGEALRQGRNVNIAVEPGDGTRYDFIVCPVFNPHFELLVARVTAAGQFRCATTVRDPAFTGDFDLEQSVERLSIDRFEGSWDRKFLHWWLTCLWLEVEAVKR